ncbi:MAG: transporter permease, putative transport system permease protein [Patescibacteria group bacterium]|nr:transporter permease, putative transport system permease protein [Patescibacteria group bacterium]
MSTIVRGVRNAFRNTIRTGGVTVILALSIGLALVMLLSLKTVQARIQTVKQSIGNTISVSPAGARGFDGGGEPLTQTDLDAVKSLPHVSGVVASLNDRLTPITDTSLASAIDPGTLGNRFRSRGGDAAPAPAGNSSGGATRTFTIPIMVSGVGQVTAAAVNATSLKFTSGSAVDASGKANVADIGTELATKNNLKVGSTFTYGTTTVTVSGIFDAGNKFANAGVIMPIATVQTLSAQPGQISTATITADDITNVPAAVTAIKAKLGTKADVVSQQDTATNAIAPLENIKTVSLYSLIGALTAGAVITFLTMLMIVRERRREIGVLKAIGASNVKIVVQFVAEAVTLTSMGAVVGVIGGLLLSNPVLKLLVTTSTSTSTTGAGPGGGGRGFARIIGGFGGQSLQNLQAVIGYDILLYGLLAALIIAVVGSALPAWLIAKVRPAEVMRGE